mmetsp:Transcript_9819/g.24047  ORF Transcript_9819/g.24047 Transcript_9819/m.24047 type:complete len:221 (+) Transcript_9819:359-1021(+)
MQAEIGCCCSGQICGSSASSNCCCGPPIWMAARGVYIYLGVINAIWGALTGLAVSVVVAVTSVGGDMSWYPAFLYSTFAVTVIGLVLGIVGGVTAQGGNPAIALGCWVTYLFLIICQLAISGVKLAVGDIVGGIGDLVFVLLVDGYCNFIIWSHWQRCKDGTFMNGGGGGVTVIVAGQMATQAHQAPMAAAHAVPMATAASQDVPMAQSLPVDNAMYPKV